MGRRQIIRRVAMTTVGALIVFTLLAYAGNWLAIATGYRP